MLFGPPGRVLVNRGIAGLHHLVEQLHGFAAEKTDIGFGVVTHLEGFGEKLAVVPLESVGQSPGMIGWIAEQLQGLRAEADGREERLALKGPPGSQPPRPDILETRIEEMSEYYGPE
jgi:hypothetical protein